MTSWTDVFRAQLYSTIYWYKNNRLLFLAMFVWPYLMVGLIFALGVMYGSIEEYSRKLEIADPVLYLLASSVVAMSSISIIDAVAGFALYNRWLGTLPYIFLSPVRTPIILIVAGLPESLLSPLITIIAIIPATVYFEGMLGAGKALLVFLFIVAGMVPMLGFASLVASLILVIKEESNVLSSLVPFTLLVAGVFYPIEILPVVLQAISTVVPVTYVVEATKLVATYQLPGAGAVLVIMYSIGALAVVYNMLAFAAIRRSERAVKSVGAI